MKQKQKQKQNRYRWLPKAGWLAGIMALAVVISLQFPVKKSHAICETQAEFSAAVSATMSGQSAAIASFITTIQTSVEVILSSARATLTASFHSFDLAFSTKLNLFWSQWRTNYEDMTAQLHTALLDQSRTLLSAYDAENQVAFQQNTQMDELKARQRYTPSEDSCVFDSTLPSAGRAEEISRAASSALSREVSSGFMNDSSIENNSPAAITANQWDNHVNLFCNSAENSGDAPCDVDGARVDADINISHTLFGRDTLRVEDPEDAIALQAAMTNLMGRPMSTVMPPSALNSPAGRTNFLQKRALAAQLNVSASIIGDIIGERLPLGVTMTEIQDMRVAGGTPILETSDQPSKYEIRQAYLEFINSPEFFKRLNDNKATLGQKDVQMKALKLMTLNDLIGKTERLTTLFAVDLANQLETAETGR